MNGFSLVGSIAVDLDGVVFEPITLDMWDERGVFGFPPLREGAIEALTKFREMGFKIIIHSCRTTPSIKEKYRFTKGILVSIVHNKLCELGVPFDEIWDKESKPLCDFYIDDRAIEFKDKKDEWLEVTRKILERSKNYE